MCPKCSKIQFFFLPKVFTVPRKPTLTTFGYVSVCTLLSKGNLEKARNIWDPWDPLELSSDISMNRTDVTVHVPIHRRPHRGNFARNVLETNVFFSAENITLLGKGFYLGGILPEDLLYSNVLGNAHVISSIFKGISQEYRSFKLF